MYKAFALQLEHLCKNYICSNNEWYQRGINNKKKRTLSFDEELKQIVVDGENLRDKIFPAFSCDVFISHSHDDERLMYCVAGMLEERFGLSVFADEFFWDSADKLLYEVDNIYCWKPERMAYDYRERNLTTSHIHVMLSSAIMKAINQCELLLFLSTNNSAPNLDERFTKGEYTMSPWIYQELLFASMVRPVLPERLEAMGEKKILLEDSFSAAYKMPPITHLGAKDLISWIESYKKGLMKCGESKHALDYLYEQNLGSAIA